jgi:aldehyde:ferredoxin oxidoreductase
MTMPDAEDKLIRLNMTDQSIVIEDYPSEWRLLGGRGLSARILLNECDPKCDPLGPDNMLIFAPGLLTGSAAPTSGRLSVGCKSPLTNGIKEANVGGDPGQHLMKLGYRAIIVTGQPADRNRRWGLEINAEGVKLKSADDFKGMWNYASCEKLLAGYPKTASAISLGPAGEMMLKGASIACTDKSKQRRPARHAARGGVGAVMGSKCLKWIAIDPGQRRARQPVEAKGFGDFIRTFSSDYLGQRHEIIAHGTSGAVPVANMFHTVPYKNRTAGRNPEVENLDGARIQESFKQRGGGMHNCMTGCIVRCSNVIHDPTGNYLTSALEFETLALLGSNCAINNWEKVAELDRLCDEVGLDTIETGAATAILMDSGGMEWGDAERLKTLLRSVDKGDETALDIANGALHIGTKRKHHRIPVGKGQALPAWDPRPVKAVGITYSTSAMGADHTAGFVLVPDQSDEDAVQASQEAQINHAIVDSAGFCIFLQTTLDEIRTFYGMFLGREVSRAEIADLAWQVLVDEWAFNEKAGFDSNDDNLPDCIRNEGIGPDNKLVFQVAPEIIAKAKVRQPARESLYTEGKI